MKRLVYYLTPYPPTQSGIADYAACFKEALEAFTDWRLQVAPQPEPALSNSLGGLLQLYRRVLYWKKTGAIQRFGLVHAEIGDKQYDEFFTLFWLRYLLPSLPYCLTIHDPPLTIMPALQPLSFGVRARSVRRMLRVMDYTLPGKGVIRSVISHAAGTFVLSDAGKLALQHVVPQYTGIHSLPFINHRLLPRSKQLGGKLEKTTKILFLGFWGHTKGIEVLLEALKIVVQKSSRRVQLLMAGGAGHGNVEQTYIAKTLYSIRRSEIKQYINVLGYLQPDEMEALFDTADICVLPYTRRSGLSSSSVLFRAMAAGMAVIVSDISPLNEEILDMETGLVVPPGNADALASALLLLLESPELRLCLGQRDEAHVFTQHAQVHVAQLVSELFDQMVAAAGGGR